MIDKIHRMGRMGRRDGDRNGVMEYFLSIEKELIRYPAINPGIFRQSVVDFCIP